MTGSGLSEVRKNLTELPDSSVRTALIKRNVYFSYNYLSSLLNIFENCLYHVIELECTKLNKDTFIKII